MSENKITNVYGNVHFYGLLQDPAILIDSDIVGAYRLIFNIRAAAQGLHISRNSFKFKLETTEKKAEEIIRSFMFANGFHDHLRNLYTNEARGVIFSGAFTEEHNIPMSFIEIGAHSDAEPFFEVEVTELVKYKTDIETRLINYLVSNGFSKDPIKISVAMKIGDNMNISSGVIDSSRYAHQSFYPFLEHDLEEYAEAFMQDSASVLVFIGPPGTGKSTLLRTIIGKSQVKSMISYSDELVYNGSLLGTALDDNYSILAIEDADTLVSSREKGNQIMASLLNTADGICQNKLKLIISTNLASVDKIDEALLRPGRCFDVLAFRPLTEEESIKVAESLKISFEDDGRTDRHWTLGQITSMGKKVSSLYSSVAKRKHFGFN